MSKRAFAVGIAACVAVMVAIGVVIAVLNAGHNRPEGVAEDWLTAVGDTVRRGVEDDARERSEKIGPLSLVDRRLVQPNPKRKSALPDLEVGKAVPILSAPTESVRVRFGAHTRRGEDEVEVGGVMTLAKSGDEWHVTALAVVGDEATDGEPASVVLAGLPELPSDGGPPPSSAPNSLWVGGLVGAVIIGAICAALVKLASRGV